MDPLSRGWAGRARPIPAARRPQSGENVTITNASYNAAIAPGGNTSLGFHGTWATSDAAPAAFTLNGAACTT
jgi:hypothetical protein